MDAVDSAELVRARSKQRFDHVTGRRWRVLAALPVVIFGAAVFYGWTLWRVLDATDVADVSVSLAIYRVTVLVALFVPFVVATVWIVRPPRWLSKINYRVRMASFIVFTTCWTPLSPLISYFLGA